MGWMTHRTVQQPVVQHVPTNLFTSAAQATVSDVPRVQPQPTTRQSTSRPKPSVTKSPPKTTEPSKTPKRKMSKAVDSTATSATKTPESKTEELKTEEPKKTETKKVETACALDDKDGNGAARFGGVKPRVLKAGLDLRCRFNVKTVLGVAGRGGVSDHPDGKALDFMVDRSTGDKLAEYILAHQEELDVKYVIWRQRYNDSSGWDRMPDRGDETANHFDHLHCSFN
jgi:hypothetical protein